MDDTLLGLNCCVLLRMNDADSDDDWFPAPLWPASTENALKGYNVVPTCGTGYKAAACFLELLALKALLSDQNRAGVMHALVDAAQAAELSELSTHLLT